MSTKQDSVFKMVAALTVTCVISGVALAFTYNVTKDRIVAAEKEARLESVRTVLPEFDGEPVEKELEIDGETYTFFIGKKDEKMVGVAVATKAIGYGGDVHMLIGMDIHGIIRGMALLQHQETPGLGTKAGGSRFLSQFIGQKLHATSDEFLVTKDGGQINAVTAATITSRAVAKAATAALHAFMKAKEQLV